MISQLQACKTNYPFISSKILWKSIDFIKKPILDNELIFYMVTITRISNLKYEFLLVYSGICAVLCSAHNDRTVTGSVMSYVRIPKNSVELVQFWWYRNSGTQFSFRWWKCLLICCWNLVLDKLADNIILCYGAVFVDVTIYIQNK